MILAIFLIISVSVCDVYNFGIDFNFGSQTESEFEDYEETAKLLGFGKQEEPKDDVISTEPDIQKQSSMTTEKPNITSKILKAPMRKFVYFTIPKLKVDELTDDDGDDHEDGDEEEDISFEEFRPTTTAATVEESPILQEENSDPYFNAEPEQDIKSELTSVGITYKSIPLHFILLLTCLLILCHHQ